MNSPENQSSYIAFISYRHTPLDVTIAKYLHTALETYRVPKAIASQISKKKLGRVFRDQDELPVSKDLSEDILNALDHSEFLIVICSPRTPLSEWCASEITYFKQHKGISHILPILIEGEPDTSFPQALTTVSISSEDGSTSSEHKLEPLAADIRGENIKRMKRKLKKYELLRLAAPILGVAYDDLRQREKERTRKQRFQLLTAGLTLLFSIILLISFGINRIQREQAKTELQALRATSEAQRAAYEQQRAENQQQRAENEQQRADTQEKLAKDLEKSSDLTFLLDDAEKDLENGLRPLAAKKAAQVLSEYSPEYSAYQLIRTKARLLLQKSCLSPAFAEYGTVTHSNNAGNDISQSVISPDNQQYICFNQETCCIEFWDLNTFELKHSLKMDHIFYSNLLLTGQGQLLVFDDTDCFLQVIDLTTYEILHTLQLSSGLEETYCTLTHPYYLYYSETTDTYNAVVRYDDNYICVLEFSLNSLDCRLQFYVVGDIDLYYDPWSECYLEYKKQPRKIGESSELTCTMKVISETEVKITVKDTSGKSVKEITETVDSSFDIDCMVSSDNSSLIVWTNGYYNSSLSIYSLLYDSIFPDHSYSFNESTYGDCHVIGIIPENNTIVYQGIHSIHLIDITSGYQHDLTPGEAITKATISPDGRLLALSSDSKTKFYTCISNITGDAVNTSLKNRKEEEFHPQYTTSIHTSRQRTKSIDTQSCHIENKEDENQSQFLIVDHQKKYEFTIDASIECFTFNEDLKQLYYITHDKQLLVWDWEKNRLLENLSMSLSELNVLTESQWMQLGSSGETIYLCTSAYTVYCIDVNTHKIRTISMKNADRYNTQVYGTILDEKHDLIYYLSVDHRDWQAISCVYSIFQLSTGELICHDLLPDNECLIDTIDNKSIDLYFSDNAGLMISSPVSETDCTISTLNVPSVETMIQTTMNAK